MWTSLTEDKTITTTKREFVKYVLTFDRPLRVVSDGGPAFMGNFSEFLQTWHIGHHLTSAHRPQSNGDGESGVKSVKSVALKLDKLDERTLRQITFNHNNTRKEDGSGVQVSASLRGQCAQSYQIHLIKISILTT